MDKNANDTFAYDLENRLDDFFGNSMSSQEESPVEPPTAPDTDLPLKKLKTTILAIDWEITDDGLAAFIDQVDGLMTRVEDDKLSHTLLKLLKSLGKYMRTHKSDAHPDTIKRIMSVYSALEELVTNPSMSQGQKEKLVLQEVKQFRRLKASITATKTSRPAGETATSVRSGQSSSMDAALRAIEELRLMVTKELKGIREEIRQLYEQ